MPSTTPNIRSGRRYSPWRILGALGPWIILQPFFHLRVVNALHHMRMIPPPVRWDKRQNSGLPLVVTNNCSDTIYPGINAQSGTGPDETGFELQPGDSKSQSVSSDWQGRVWGRTNCSFNSNSGGSQACSTGDCNGAVNCQVAGDVPVTLAEFTYNGGDGHTYYDISLVDGYNIPLAIVMQSNGNASFEDIPPNLTNPSCVATVGELAAQGYDPYSSGYPDFLNTNSTYAIPFDEKVDDKQVANWCPWDLQQNPPDSPSNGVYQYPDTTVERPAFDPCYSACAKNNQPQDCCTGQYDSSSRCQPSNYSKAAKGVCPDAYSYAFDDQTSTFILPAGAGFEVVFCPGARSSNILATYGDQLRQVAQGQSVDGCCMSNSSSSSSKREALETLIRNVAAAARSVKFSRHTQLLNWTMAVLAVWVATGL